MRNVEKIDDRSFKIVDSKKGQETVFAATKKAHPTRDGTAVVIKDIFKDSDGLTVIKLDELEVEGAGYDNATDACIALNAFIGSFSSGSGGGASGVSPDDINVKITKPNGFINSTEIEESTATQQVFNNRASAQIQTNTNNINSARTLIEQVQNTLSEHQEQIQTNANNIDGALGIVSMGQTLIAQAQNTLTELQAQIQANTVNITGAGGLIAQIQSTLAELQDFEQLAGKYINALQIICTVTSTSGNAINLTFAVGKNCIITKTDGTVVYQGAITSENATTLTLNAGEGIYSILIQDSANATADVINSVSTTVTKTTVYGTVIVTGSLTSVNVPGTATSIISQIKDNPLIQEVYLNEGVVTLGTTNAAAGAAITNLNSLRKLTIPSTLLNWNYPSGSAIAAVHVGYNCPNLRELIVPHNFELPTGFWIFGDMFKNKILDVFNRAAEVPTARTIYISAANNNKLTAEEILIITDKNYTVVVK
ncbi:MAG: hypothetical protein FWF72_06795 [Paludibacter sp.]|nr:hypothetical protein [Paludibacter sp.]